MDLVAEESEYCDNIDEELSRIGIDIGEDMKDILNHFHGLNKELEKKMYKNKADEIFKCIPMKMETFYDKFTTECMDNPILNYYDTYQMVQRITCASNEDIVKIKEMLIDRAKKNKEALKPELPFIISLKCALEEYYNGKDISIKIVMIREFANDLDLIIKLYNED